MISQNPLPIGKDAVTTMKAAIVSIGDEVVLGEKLDTNTAWLAAQLAERSIQTVEHRTVGDDRDAVALAVIDLASRLDVVILTGGLGPTDDDLVREAMGDVVNPGEALVTDVEAVDALQARFAQHGRAMPELNLRQAKRPKSMRLLANPHGTAPGLAGRLGNCLVFALPGPPREMKPMFQEYVAPKLSTDRSASAMLVGLVHAIGIGESDAAQRLGELMDRERNPLIGTTVSDSIVTARIRARGPIGQMQDLLQADMQRVEQAWWPYAYGNGETTLARAVGELMCERGRTLVTAESCTGGWLGKMLVDSPGASTCYLGGWVTYSNDMKTANLAVPHEMIEAHGAVSQQVAEAMASGAMANVDADYALAITGIAGPDGGTVQKPVGTVYISLARTEDSLLNVSTRHFVFPGDRMTVRDRSAKAALQILRFSLLDLPDNTPLLWEAPRRTAAALHEIRQ